MGFKGANQFYVIEMWDEIFKFESFINFVNFFVNISRPPFWNFHWNFVF